MSFWWCLFRWFLCMKRIVLGIYTRLARHDFNFTVVGDGSVAFAGRLRAIVGHQHDRWNVGGVRGDGGLWSPRYHHATTAVVLVSILGAACVPMLWGRDSREDIVAVWYSMGGVIFFQVSKFLSSPPPPLTLRRMFLMKVPEEGRFSGGRDSSYQSWR